MSYPHDVTAHAWFDWTNQTKISGLTTLLVPKLQYKIRIAGNLYVLYRGYDW